MQAIEYFDGIMRFNSAIMFFNILVLFFFVIEWYYHYKKTGAYIDYWYYNMFLLFFIPVLLMYPFSSAFLNIFAVLGANNLYIVESNINEAYFVTMLGFLAVYLGRYYYDYSRVWFIESIITVFSQTLGVFFEGISNDKKVTRRFTTLYLVIMSFFVIFLLTAGLARNPREFFKINTQYTPIYTLILYTYQLVFAIISTRVLQFNKIIDTIMFVLLITFGFFLGVRAPVILYSMSFGVLFVLYKKQGFIPISRVLVSILLILTLVMVMSFIRNDSTGDGFDTAILAQSILPELFYGNTFSDLRDFSWVLGNWNHDLYYGLTYFAAFMSFIPSSIFPIRDTYGIGKITVGITGLDLSTHPGLRMGIFGEMFMNFGFVGVVLFGFFWGYILRRVDILTKRYLNDNDVIKASSVLVYSAFVTYLTGSSGFWGFYISLFVLALLYFFTKIKLSKSFGNG